MNLDELVKIREEKERRMLMVSSAREEWEAGENTKANAEVILQDLYESLSCKGKHVDISVLEQLTDIKFTGLNQLVKDRYEV